MTDKYKLIEEAYKNYASSKDYTSLENSKELNAQEKVNCLVCELYEQVQKKLLGEQLLNDARSDYGKYQLENEQKIIDLTIDKIRRHSDLYQMVNSDDKGEDILDHCYGAFYGNLSEDDLNLFDTIEKCLAANNEPLLLKRRHEKNTDGKAINSLTGKLSLVPPNNPAAKDFVSSSAWFAKQVRQMLQEQDQVVDTLNLVHEYLDSVDPAHDPCNTQKIVDQVQSMLSLLIHGRQIALDSDKDTCMTFENSHLDKAKDQFGYDDPFEETNNE
ncbi:hypothetical protein [Enterococcus sp. AZ163]|uniref:hypothetical protein n=1 Tax=Enterococcus sp. AZ163 TaxID=2774638 RepID=UPI003D2A6B25